MSNISPERKMCHFCKEIINGEMLRALDKMWHVEHFCCCKCSLPIGASKFYTNKNMPYCSHCYSKLFLFKCKNCSEPIVDRFVEALDSKWHEEHFCCQNCESKLSEAQFVVVKGAPFCQNCYFEKHAPKCRACSKPIFDSAIIALKSKWHQTCFRCVKCKKLILKDQSFKVDNGNPCCVQC